MSSEVFAFPQLEGAVTVSELGDAFAAARREADAARERATEEGFAAGHAEGLAAAQAEAAAGLAAVRAAAAALEALREQVVAEAEQDALALAFELAERVVAGAIAVEPARVLDVARHALRHLSQRRHVTLVVNPDDLAFMAASAPELQAELGGIEHLAVQADRRVGRGGAVAATEAGEIDAGLQVQLDRARELVADALAEELPDAGALLADTDAVPAVAGPDVASDAD